MYFIHILLLFYHFYFSKGDTENIVSDISVHDVAETFLHLIGNVGKNDSKRIKELKNKLQRIDSYVVDKDKYAELLRNVTNRTSLNETNFYEALHEQNHFQFQNESKSIYLKLKEKINREDVLKILMKKGGPSIMKSALNLIRQKYKAKGPQDKDLVGVMDKFLGETAGDVHKYNKSHEYSHYWDPKIELEERRTMRQMNARRIYRGERTSVRHYPFMASVHVMGRFWCGGVICSHDLIITSASCLQLLHNNRYYRENPNVVMVRIGSNHSKVGGDEVAAMEVYFHPTYRPKTLENNIAVIRLIRSIRFNYHRVPKLIELTTNAEGMPFTAEVLVLGWGVNKVGHKLPYEPIFLQRKILPVYPKKFCQEIYGEKFITATMFCAGTVSTGEGACNHDAGGPAVLNGKLVGIISFGPSVCGMADAPTVFTLVGAYTDWIETLNETMPSYYRHRKRTTTPYPDILWDLIRTQQVGTTFPALAPHIVLLMKEMAKGKNPDRSINNVPHKRHRSPRARDDNAQEILEESTEEIPDEEEELETLATTTEFKIEPVFVRTTADKVNSRTTSQESSMTPLAVNLRTSTIPDVQQQPIDEIHPETITVKTLRRRKETESEELFNAYFQ